MFFWSLVVRSALVALSLAATSSGVWPHAYLDAASPADGSSGPSPAEIRLRFTEDIEPEFSTLVLKNAAGARVPTGKPRQPAANSLAVDVGPLAPGSYTAEWRVLSVDTHITDGVVRFTVAPPTWPRGR